MIPTQHWPFAVALTCTLLILSGGCTGQGGETSGAGHNAASEDAGNTPDQRADVETKVDGGPFAGSLDWSRGDPVEKCEIDQLLSGPTYGTKVKNLLTGLPLDESEFVTMRDTPDLLPELIDTWVDMPEAKTILRQFLATAFQQDGVTRENLLNLVGRPDVTLGRFRNDQLPPDFARTSSDTMDVLLGQNLAESMARTALYLMDQGRPFSEVVTTRQFMMTTAMMTFLAFMDDNVIDDEQNHNLRTTAGHFPTLTLVRDKEAAPPAHVALDPNAAEFATFWHPKIATLVCGNETPPEQIVITEGDRIVEEWRLSQANHSYFVFAVLAFGRIERALRHQSAVRCILGASNQSSPMLQYDDMSDWRLVTIRPPAAGESPDLFYDVPSLRSKDELVVHTPRVGFLSHAGFHGTWMTNEDNGSRVTVNQSLIVGLGRTFENTVLEDYDPLHVDTEHAGDAECFGCHQTLDPMRDLIRGTYTNFYGHQTDPDRKDRMSDFVFQGARSEGISGIEGLADEIAKHPLFAEAWTQKLCSFANASPCPEGPELDRVVAAFATSNLDFRVLIREIFSSPLVTGGSCLPGIPAGTSATISRRSAFCAQLSHRTGLSDLCGQSTDVQTQTSLQESISQAITAVPKDGYSRDQVELVTISETGLFVRANREAACNHLSRDSDTFFWKDYPVNPTATEIDTGVQVLMENIVGLRPADPLYAPIETILRDHISEVAALVPEGSSEPLGATAGLRSALSLACMAPSSAGIGF
jgi:hypothetical protein